MNKNKKTALAPRLQFPEFRDNGEWKEERLDKFFSIGSSKRVLQEQWTYKGVPFYRTRELVSLSKGEPFGSEIFISEELYNVLSETYGVPSEGDFLVSGVGTLGVSYQVKAEDKFYFKDGNVLWFKLNEGLYSTYFKYSFQSDYIQKQIYGQTSKSTVGTYTIQNAKKTKLWCPPTISEQKKIANCFSSLDDLITAEDKKLEAFKAHKKGLMQKLFPVEGKTLPEWRFPEFKDGGNWEETSFKQVFSKLQYGLNAAAKEYDGKNKYIRITDIDESSRRYLSEKAVSPDCELDDVYLVREGDILFARTGASTGKTYIYTTDDGILYFAGFLIRGNVNERYYPQFVFDQTLSTNYEKWVAITSTRSGQPGINANEYGSFMFSCPSLPEQKKIADCLSSVDDLITQQTKKIEALNQHKKGLMQGLFPSIEEVCE